MLRVAAIICCIAASGGARADEEAPRVGASLDRTEAHVGDRLTLTVSAIARGNLAKTVRLPLKLDLGKFEVLDSSTSDRDLGDGNQSRRFVLQIAAYETGELELPPITLDYTGADGKPHSVGTTAIPVQMKSVIDDEAAGLQPLKATRDALVEDRRVYAGLKWSGAAAAAFAVLLLGRFIVGRRRRRPVIVAPPPVRPADELALERLAELRRRGDFALDGYRPFHFALSEIVRGYLGARFRFDALELTTTELIAAIDKVADPLLTAQSAPIASLLGGCDLVKFAKMPSSDADARAALDAAEAIVRATRPAAAPAPAQEAAHA